MKKLLLVGLILVALAIQGGGIYSQGSEAEPVTYFGLEKMEAGPNSAESGPVPYYTHPEFTNIMTTTVTTPAQNVDEGYLFVGTLNAFSGFQSAVMILDNTGEPIYINTEPNEQFVGDFRVQTINGVDYLTYHSGTLPGNYTFGSSYILDQNYNLVDTWTINNGLGADVHDFLLLDNGHAILMAYVPIPFDLTPYGGPADGTLIDIVIQEQDADKNVVFEWVATDHMPIEDTQENLNTTDPIDFLHTNAVAVDYDGNLLLSHRNFSEITKISRQTGEIIWRMGGAGNEFTFTNDIGFFNQHHVNRLDDGTLLLFDNGTFHTPPHSRAVGYVVDEIAKTATRYGMYPGDTSIFSNAMGSAQRLPNGNTMIGWGTRPVLTEVQTTGMVSLEMQLGSPSYRVFRYPWIGVPAAAPRTAVIPGPSQTITLYTSWNGATDIVSYDVFAGPTIGSMEMVDNEPKSGFETEIVLDINDLPADTCFFRTQPIHAQGSPTPLSNLVYRFDVPECQALVSHTYIPVSLK